MSVTTQSEILFGRCRHERVAILHLFFSPRDVGEHQHSAHRRCGIDISVEQFSPSRRAQWDGPENIAIAGIDGEQWTVAIGTLQERGRDVFVLKIAQADTPGFIKIRNNRR